MNPYDNYHKDGERPGPAPAADPSPRPSRRPSPRSDFGGQGTRTFGEKQGCKGGDSIPIQGIPIPSAARPASARSSRLTRTQLEQIEAHLTARDHAVLQSLRRYRFLSSSQIGRLYVTDCRTVTSRTRQQNLLLKRLSGYGLIRALAQRVGGEGGGSSRKIWYLTEAGCRLLTLNDPGANPRQRFSEPSTALLRHTLACSECAVQMTCICRESEDLELMQVDSEPACWRCYRDAEGRLNYLKPDLFAITSCGEYEEHWFIEMDLGTEAPMDVVEKCDAYLRYYYTNIEQKETDLFPLVVWVAIDQKRKDLLQGYIEEHIQGHPKMFLVITPDELEKALREEIDSKELL